MRLITDNIYYVGVNDRNKHLFEGLWPLPAGVSYNSYLIDDEKVCLIDTVEVGFFGQFIENIRDVIGDTFNKNLTNTGKTKTILKDLY